VLGLSCYFALEKSPVRCEMRSELMSERSDAPEGPPWVKINCARGAMHFISALHHPEGSLFLGMQGHRGVETGFHALICGDGASTN
jgi:hypothetical protein